MPKTRASKKIKHFGFRNILYLLIMLLLLYLVVPRISVFTLTIHQFSDVNYLWVSISVVSFILTFFLAGGIYYFLSKRELPYFRTVIVQVAGLFANRLLPAGSGALGVNYLYLRRQRFDNARAIAAVATNNLLGFVGHMLLLGALSISFPIAFSDIKIPVISERYKFLIIVLLVTILALVWMLPRLRYRLAKAVREPWLALLRFRHQPASLSISLVLSMMLSLGYAFCLFAAARALGLNISSTEALLVLTASVVAAEVVPLPGGLGSAEAGIVAGLVSLGYSAQSSLAVALLYRFVTFWLALITGLIAFIFVERKKYLQLSRKQ